MKFLVALVLVLVGVGSAGAKEPVTVYLAGDSTMAEKTADKRPETGWGEMLQSYFKTTDVRIVNLAKNGRSTRSFIDEKLWTTLLDRVKKGDYVFIQFGHNDQKENTDRYASPTDYGVNLKRFVTDVRAKHAIPVLFTPVMRRRFDEKGNFYDTHGQYPDVVRQTAAELKVPLIDMHRESEKLLRELGPEASRSLFLQLPANQHPNYPQGVEDNTHFNDEGAKKMAAIAVKELRKLKLDVARYVIKGLMPERRRGEISWVDRMTRLAGFLFGIASLKIS
jgi:lysophospholipase L1-like esterase